MKNTRPQQESRKRVVPFLIISLLIHLLIMTTMIIKDMFFSSTQIADQKPEPSVQFLEFADMGRLVDQDETETNNQKPKDSKFLSAKDKTVKKETKAVHHGDFQNRDSKPAQKSATQQASQAQVQQAQQAAVPSSTAESMKTFKGGDMFVPSKKQEQKAATVSDLRPNTLNAMSESAMETVSQTPDYLKDVAAGAETHLNTAEFLYYSYFNRIRKDLRQRWEPLIHQKVRDVIKKGQQRELASTDTKMTSVLFTLDDRGVITRIQVRTTSGLSDLDDAAIEALRAIGQFPHPPKDLVINGIVQIPWTFILES